MDKKHLKILKWKMKSLVLPPFFISVGKGLRSAGHLPCHGGSLATG